MTKRIGLDLPDDLHAWIKWHAKQHRRSLQQDVLWLLEFYRERFSTPAPWPDKGEPK